MSRSRPGQRQVRPGVRYAIDVDAIVAGAYNNTVPARDNLLHPAARLWKDTPVYKHDPDKAKACSRSRPDQHFTDPHLAERRDLPGDRADRPGEPREAGINVTLKPLDGGAYWALGDHDASKDLELTLIRIPPRFDPSFQTQWFLSIRSAYGTGSAGRARSSTSCTRKPLRSSTRRAREEVHPHAAAVDESASCIWITHGVHVFGHDKWFKPAFMRNASMAARFYDKADPPRMLAAFHFLPAAALRHRAVTVVGAVAALFLLIQFVPGDLVSVLLGAASDPGAQAAITAKMGLDEPFLTRLWLFFPSRSGRFRR